MLLDVDGTLIDSNDAHGRAWCDALREFGRDIPFETVRSLIGMGGDKLIPRLLGVGAESERGTAFSDRRSTIFFERYVPTLRRTPGAKELVLRLRSEKLRLVVATSAKEEEMNRMLEQVGLEDLVHRRTTSDDADRSKPDPDIVVAALRKSGLSAHEVVMIGDTPYDVEAATRAGVAAIGFRSGGWSADDLRGTIAVYDDPAHLLREFNASAFASAA